MFPAAGLFPTRIRRRMLRISPDAVSYGFLQPKPYGNRVLLRPPTRHSLSLDAAAGDGVQENSCQLYNKWCQAAQERAPGPRDYAFSRVAGRPGPTTPGQTHPPSRMCPSVLEEEADKSAALPTPPRCVSGSRKHLELFVLAVRWA